MQEIYIILTPYAPLTLTDFSRMPHDRSIRLHAIWQVAQGLQHIHSCGIIHRDIKPDNILVTNESDVFITDFGHSTLEATSKDHFKGTLQYLAPEIYELKQGISDRGVWSDKSDVFSFGVVAFEVLYRSFRRNGERLIGRPIQFGLLQVLHAEKNDLSSLLAKALTWDVRRRPNIDDILLSPVWPQPESRSPTRKRPRKEP